MKKEYRLSQRPSLASLQSSQEQGSWMGLHLCDANDQSFRFISPIKVKSLSTDHQPDGMWIMEGLLWCPGLGSLKMHCVFCPKEDKFDTKTTLLTVEVPDKDETPATA